VDLGLQLLFGSTSGGSRFGGRSQQPFGCMEGFFPALGGQLIVGLSLAGRRW
jgi:hypothetical protein